MIYELLIFHATYVIHQQASLSSYMGSLQSTTYTAAACILHLWAAAFVTCCSSHLVTYCECQAWDRVQCAAAFQVLHQRFLMHRFGVWCGSTIGVTRSLRTFGLEGIEQVRTDIDRAFQGPSTREYQMCFALKNRHILQHIYIYKFWSEPTRVVEITITGLCTWHIYLTNALQE